MQCIKRRCGFNAVCNDIPVEMDCSMVEAIVSVLCILEVVDVTKPMCISGGSMICSRTRPMHTEQRVRAEKRI